MATKTCFLICPIGDEGSDVRKLSDDLMELIIIPALERFDFDVMRADKIPRPSVITNDIIQLVQNSELCIIDLTGSNPNVFYECGRRHETGKPFIQLIKKGEILPFDVAGIRTIIYDLSTVRSAHDTIKEIQKYVAEMSTSGFSPRTAGESLSSLANAIQRIERKLDSVSLKRSIDRDSAETEFLDNIRIEANPLRAFYEAFEDGKLDKARAILPILHARLGNVNNVLIAASIFANHGDSGAKEICLKILNSPTELLDAEVLVTAIKALSSYYDIVDEEEEGTKVIEPIVQTQVKRDDIDDTDKAFILNRLQMLYYSSGQFENALTIIEQVIDLNPNGEVYFYNKAMILSRLGMSVKAAETIDRYMELIGAEKVDFNDYARAALIYAKAERIPDAKRTIAKMKKIDKQLAEKFISENTGLNF